MGDLHHVDYAFSVPLTFKMEIRRLEANLIKSWKLLPKYN